MSALTDIFSYWQGNSDLLNVVPYANVYTDLIPAGTPLPYVRVSLISSLPSFTTCPSYFDNSRVQFSVFADDLDVAESIAATVMAQFDYVAFSPAYVSMERENYMVMADQDTPKRVYHALIEYTYRFNAELGQV